MKKLDIEQAEPIRKKFARSWEIRKGKYLYKKVAFDDYNQVLRFLMAIEQPQIKLDHFADFMNFYNELTIAITTHDVNGLTQLDFELALYIDKALEQMDARQLEENFADGKTKAAIDKYQQTNPVGKTSRAFTDIEEEYLHIRELALKLMKNGLDAYTAYYKASEKMQFDPAMVFDWMGSEFKDEELEDFIPIEYEHDWIKRAELGMSENFADGKVKGKSRPGRVKRSGASCNGSVTSLRKRAKNASGEKAKMYHWCANMKSGRKK